MSLRAAVLLSLALACSGEAAPTPGAAMQPTARAFFILEANGGATRERSLVVKGTIVNAGNVPLWLLGRLSFGSEQAPRAHTPFELWLEIIGPDGSPPAYRCNAPYRMLPELSQYVVIGVGKRWEQIANIGCFDLSRPGWYIVKASYKDANDDPPWPPPGSVHLSTRIVSPPAFFHIPN